jgi:hypothetical protein
MNWDAENREARVAERFARRALRRELRVRRSPMSGSGRIFLGVAAIVLGVAFLLDNLGIMPFDLTIRLWPSLFIVFGVLKIAQSRQASGYMMGCGLVLVGAVMLLNDMGLMRVHWSALWPLFIIALGLSMVFRSSFGGRWRDGAAGPLDKPGNDDSVVDISAILGGYSRRIATPVFRGGEITAIMGGCELDLRQSGLQDEAVLNVFAVCGGISLKVPPDWSVILQGTPILGGFEEKTIEPPDASKRLIIRGYAIMGGLEVRN